MTPTANPRLIIVCLALAAAGCASRPPAGGWQKVGGPLRNVSGMALVSAEPNSQTGPTYRFLVVHDNKAPHEPRVGAVSVGRGVRYRALPWPRNVAPPVDLEAICPLPGTPGSFLALTSAGRLLHLRSSGGDVEVLHESVLPGLSQTTNLEAFAVQSLAGQTVAVWGHRGEGSKPGVLYWGTYDPVADVVALQGQADVRVAYPAGENTRHVTDVRVDRGGVVWATAASDPGDKGPFEAALYALGTLGVEEGRVTFRASPARSPAWTTKRKVEALELLPGNEGIVYFGADDEAAGGWVYVGRR